MTRGDELAVLSAERAVVDSELHHDRGRISGNVRQCGAILVIDNGFADEDFFEARDAHNVARVRFGNFHTLETLKVKDGGDFAGRFDAVAVNAHCGIADFDFTGENLAERNSTEVIAIVEIRDELLKTFAGAGAGRRDVLDDRIKKRLHARGWIV